MYFFVLFFRFIKNNNLSTAVSTTHLTTVGNSNNKHNKAKHTNGSNGRIVDGGKAQPVPPPSTKVGPEKFQPETASTHLQTVVISKNNSRSSSNVEATVTTALLASEDINPVNVKISGTYFRQIVRNFLL